MLGLPCDWLVYLCVCHQALDLLLDKMKRAGLDFSSVRALSGSGQVRPEPASVRAPVTGGEVRTLVRPVQLFSTKLGEQFLHGAALCHVEVKLCKPISVGQEGFWFLFVVRVVSTNHV